MSGFKGVIGAAVFLWLAAGLNMGMAAKVEILGAHPDFLLIVMGVLTTLMTRSGGALLGFFSGLVYGSLAGANLAQYCISRTFAGFGAGWLTDVGFQPSYLMAALGTMFVTLVAQLLLMFSAPPNQITPFLWDTLGMAIYNGVLAVPFYALVKRIFETQSK